MTPRSAAPQAGLTHQAHSLRLHASCSSALSTLCRRQHRSLSALRCDEERLGNGAVVCAAPAVSREAARPESTAKRQAELTMPTMGKLLNGGTSFAEEHRIRGYEVGPDQKTTIVTIANLLQEVAGNHAVALWGRTEAGYATDPIMVERHLIFAATRIQIAMERYPKWGDVLQIETWFQEEGRVAACRNWLISDVASGEVIGRGTSTWVMLNTVTRRMAKIPDEMRAKMEYMSPPTPRHSFAPGDARQKIPNLALPAELEGAKQVARRSDMDMNGHINNVTYLAWALETVPADVYLNYALAQVEVDYKAECMAGQTVESLGSRADDASSNGCGVLRFVHLLRRCDDKGCYELVRARTTWRPDYKSLGLAAPRLHA